MTTTPWVRGAAVAALAAAFAGLPGTAPAESGCGASYTVRSGDTLARIAERCGTTVEALAQANAVITHPGRISVGWELTIPGAAPGAAASLGPEAEVRPRARGEAAEAALAEGSYEVRPGDSFASIATALQIPMRDLMAANDGVDPFGLRPGQTLQLPPGAAAGTAEQPAGAADHAPGEADQAPGAAADLNAEETAEAPAAAGRAAEAGQPAPGEQEVQAEPDQLAAASLTLEGRVESGAECPILETPGGDVYSLVSADYGFMPGEYVEIEGETVEQSFCMQGKATVRVTSMTAIPAPQGG